MRTAKASRLFASGSASGTKSLSPALADRNSGAGLHPTPAVTLPVRTASISASSSSKGWIVAFGNDRRATSSPMAPARTAIVTSGRSKPAAVRIPAAFARLARRRAYDSETGIEKLATRARAGVIDIPVTMMSKRSASRSSRRFGNEACTNWAFTPRSSASRFATSTSNPIRSPLFAFITQGTKVDTPTRSTPRRRTTSSVPVGGGSVGAIVVAVPLGTEAGGAGSCAATGAAARRRHPRPAARPALSQEVLVISLLPRRVAPLQRSRW